MKKNIFIGHEPMQFENHLALEHLAEVEMLIAFNKDLMNN